MLSAKLANTTVNQSHSAIWNAHQGSAPVRKSSMVETVASTATISVARITGLPVSLRGSSLTKESWIARTTTWELSVVPATAERRFSPRWTAGAAAVIGIEAPKRSVLLRHDVQHLEVLDDRAKGLGGEVHQAAHDDDHADQEADEQRPVGRQGAGGGRQLRLDGDRASHGQDRQHIGEAAEQHGD